MKRLLDKSISIFFISILVITSIIPNMSGSSENSISQNEFLEDPPEEEWNRTFGGINHDYGESVQQTNDGGYIICATYNSTSSHETSDILLIKTDRFGIEEWNRTFGGFDYEWGYDVKQTSDGGFIIIGETQSYGPCLYSSAWLIKTDINGYEQWNKTYGISLWYGCEGRSVQETKDGGFIFVGTYFPLYGDNDMLVVKTNSTGNVKWYKKYGTPGTEKGYSIQQTQDGGYILIGETYPIGTGHKDILLIKTNWYGKIIWEKTFGSENNDFTPSVQQTSDGGFIISFTYNSSFNYSDSDVCLIKTSNNGNMEWINIFGGTDDERSYSVRQTIDGGYVVVGLSYSFGSGSNDVWLIKTDNRGYEQWNITIGSFCRGSGKSVEQTVDGGFIICGFKSNGSRGYDAWLIKLTCKNLPPYVEIVNPKEGYIHFSGIPLFPTLLNLIDDTISIGGFQSRPIQIKAIGNNPLAVTLLINNEDQGPGTLNLETGYYEWEWTERAFGNHLLRARAKDIYGEIGPPDEMIIWNFCLMP